MSINVYDDLKAANNIINGNFLKVNRTIYKPMYPWTNERIDLYCNCYDLSNKQVLAVTSSFDHALFAIYNGAKSVDCFDINRFCKYYADLKRAMLFEFNEDDFEKILKFSADDLGQFRINPIFSLKQLRKHFILPESFIFWHYVLNNPNFRDYNYLLFRSDAHPRHILPNYYSLRKKLIASSIRFFDFNLVDINNFLNPDHKYDAIFLSNIMDFFSDNSVFNDVINNWLNDGGLLFDYHMCSGQNRDYNIKPIDIINCSTNNSKSFCKIYTKARQTKKLN